MSLINQWHKSLAIWKFLNQSDGLSSPPPTINVEDILTEPLWNENISGAEYNIYMTLNCIFFWILRTRNLSNIDCGGRGKIIFDKTWMYTWMKMFLMTWFSFTGWKFILAKIFCHWLYMLNLSITYFLIVWTALSLP